MDEEREPELDEAEVAYSIEHCAKVVGAGLEECEPTCGAARCHREWLRNGASSSMSCLARWLSTTRGHLAWVKPYDPLALHPDRAPRRCAGPSALLGAYAHSPAVIAILRRWEERYGAKLVAHWGTMLQVFLWQHAATLVGRGAWFVHERP